MNYTRALVAVLGCAAMGVGGELHAQARGPAAHEVRGSGAQDERPPIALDDAARARKLAELAEWLGRLKGQFQIDAKWAAADRIDRFRGTAQCNGFGDGPGVRCIIRVVRPVPQIPARMQLAQSTTANVVHNDDLLPILYFGVAPDKLEIQLVMVDFEQVAARSGVLTADTVEFSDNWKVCHGVWTVCWIASEMTALPAGDVSMRLAADAMYQGRTNPILLKNGHMTDIQLQLHREIPADARVPPDGH